MDIKAKGKTHKVGNFWLIEFGPFDRNVVESVSVYKKLLEHYPEMLVLPRSTKRNNPWSFRYLESEKWQWIVLLGLGIIGTFILIRRMGTMERIHRSQKVLEKEQIRLEGEIHKGEKNG